jgi:hypothetical protein
MKPVYTFLLFLFIITSSYSQVATFHQFNEPYQYLQNENIPFENFKWGESFSFDIDIPYQISFDSLKGNNLLIQAHGYGTLATPFDPEGGYLWLFPYISFNLIDRAWKLNLPNGISPISYKYETLGGERVLKVQWKNAGFEFGSINDSLNLQIWLFENSQKVQYRYGPSYVANFDSISIIDTAQIGIEIQTNSLDMYTMLSGTSANHTLQHSEFAKFYGLPPSGTVYEFRSLISSTNLIKQKNEFSYSVVNDILSIKINPENKLNKLELLDLNGRKIKSLSSNSFDITDIQNGLYILVAITNNGVYKEKIVINH